VFVEKVNFKFEPR